MKINVFKALAKKSSSKCSPNLQEGKLGDRHCRPSQVAFCNHKVNAGDYVQDDDEEKQVDHLGGTGLGGLCREREEEAEECEADEE